MPTITPGITLNGTGPTPSTREFLPGAREELLALLSSSAGASGGDYSSAAEKLWPGVLSVVLESAKAQGDWNLAQALVKAGAEIGRLDLHEAIEGGHDRFAAALVGHGAPVDTEGEDHCTPLHIAARHGSAEIAQRLLRKGADVESPSTESPLSLAAARGSAAVVEVLMVAGADPHRFTGSSLSPFGEAADKGHDGVLKVMIGLGANVNAVDGDGYTALHVAMGAAVVDVLVEAGADVEARNNEGFTPLLSAAEESRIDTVRALVNHGADINAKDPHGKTPLHWAAGHAWIGVGMVDFLLRSGADEAMVDRHGEKPADELKGFVGQGEKNIQRARKLLTEAPVDRAWRRRGLLLMCIVFYRRDQLPCVASDAIIPGIDTQGPSTSTTAASGTDVAEEGPRGGWTAVSGWLAGLRPGQEGIFRKIVGYV